MCQLWLKGTTCLIMSCQFGPMLTDPAAPHAMRTGHQPTRDHRIQGKPVEPKVHGAFAAAVEALDVAGDVTACDPLGSQSRA